MKSEPKKADVTWMGDWDFPGWIGIGPLGCRSAVGVIALSWKSDDWLILCTWTVRRLVLGSPSVSSAGSVNPLIRDMLMNEGPVRLDEWNVLLLFCSRSIEEMLVFWTSVERCTRCTATDERLVPSFLCGYPMMKSLMKWCISSLNWPTWLGSPNGRVGLTLLLADRLFFWTVTDSSLVMFGRTDGRLVTWATRGLDSADAIGEKKSMQSCLMDGVFLTSAYLEFIERKP